MILANISYAKNDNFVSLFMLLVNNLIWISKLLLTMKPRSSLWRLLEFCHPRKYGLLIDYSNSKRFDSFSYLR